MSEDIYAILIVANSPEKTEPATRWDNYFYVRPKLLIKSPVDFRLNITYNGRTRTLKIRKGRNFY